MMNHKHCKLIKKSGRSLLLANLALAVSSAAWADCSYTITNNWGSGYTGEIKVTNNTNQTVNGWSVSWRDSGTITSSWNASLSGSNPYTATSVDWNRTLAPNASATFGFQGTGSASVAAVSGSLCGAAASSSSKSSVAPSSAAQSSAAPSSKAASSVAASALILQEGQNGFCSVNGTIDSDNSGYTGSGFANTENAQGTAVSWAVSAANSSRYTLTFRYANGGTSPRNGSLLINGGSNGNYTVELPSTGSWTNWQTASIEVDLVQGNNSVKLTAVGAEGLSNIDSLQISGGPTAPGSCSGTTSSAPKSSASSSTTTSAASSSSVPTSQCNTVMGYATRSGRTGGAVSVTGGGNATPIVVKTFADLVKYATDSSPRVIHIDGTVGSGWSGTNGDRLSIGSNKTIVGLRPGTQLRAPIHIKNASNVIVRNLVIKGPGSNSDQAWDNLNIEGTSKNIWIDHNEFWDGQDGNADVVKGADNVTFTWNIFGYTTNGGHNFSNLVASSDNEPVSEGKLNITFMFNHFKGVAQRAPRCRYGNIHVVNNLFTTGGLPSQMAISAGVQCKAVVENNHFIGISEPVHQRSGGAAEVRGSNIFENTSGDKTSYGGSAFVPPYQYTSVLVDGSRVKGMVEAGAGATLKDAAACK
ncbi:MAG TPA: cellulose binding domain-containing protein [Cellvibrio sp.]|nr:cellulose binding domain-containing protein [Cellvibrio sp.]